jgi:hypothetical protein
MCHDKYVQADLHVLNPSTVLFVVAKSAQWRLLSAAAQAGSFGA